MELQPQPTMLMMVKIMKMMSAHRHTGTLAHWHTSTLAHWHSGTVAYWHTGTLERAHSWLSLVMVSLLTRSLSNHSLLPTRHLRRSPEIKLHLI